MFNGPERRLQAAVSDLDEDGNLSNDEAFDLVEKVKSNLISNLATNEQKQLERVVDSLNLDEKSRQSLDQNGTRFLTLFRHFVNSQERVSEIVQTVPWREIAWAYHSQSQEILLDRVSRHYGGKMLWRSAREAGLFLWITDHAALVYNTNVLAFIHTC